MTQAPTEEDGQRLLRQQAMTSQHGRGFSNHKRTRDSGAASALGEGGEVLAADKKLKEEMTKYDALHRPTSLASLTKQREAAKEGEKEAFKWDYEAVMNDNKIDKERNKQLLSGAQGIDSRFAAPKESRRFL